MDAKAIGLCLLASVVAGMEDGDPVTGLYTVPVDKFCIVTHCVVRNPTGILGDEYDFGDGVSANTWVTAVDLSTMTASSDYYVVEGNNTKYTVFDAGDVFGINPVIGGAPGVDAAIDVFGYIF